MQVTVSPLQEDPDHYWERREKESKSSLTAAPQTRETKGEDKSDASNATAVKVPDGDAPQALEDNFERFLANPTSPSASVIRRGWFG